MLWDLPRFTNLSSQANIAANQGFVGTVKSSFSIIHPAWIASGAPNGSTNLLTIDGSNISVNNNGWPSGANDVSNLTIPASSCAACISGAYDIINAPQVQTSCTDAPANICYLASAAVAGVCTLILYNGSTATTHGFTYNYVTGAIAAY